MCHSVVRGVLGHFGRVVDQFLQDTLLRDEFNDSRVALVDSPLQAFCFFKQVLKCEVRIAHNFSHHLLVVGSKPIMRKKGGSLPKTEHLLKVEHQLRI